MVFPLTGKLFPALERILLTLWVGALWTTGFMVAPVLFAELDDRALAGSLAGSLFTLTSYLGLACGGVLLVLNGFRIKGVNWRMVVIAGMLILVVIGQFVVTPMVAELRVQGLTDTPRFGQLHGIASVLFLLSSVLGLVLALLTPFEAVRAAQAGDEESVEAVVEPANEDEEAATEKAEESRYRLLPIPIFVTEPAVGKGLRTGRPPS